MILAALARVPLNAATSARTCLRFGGGGLLDDEAILHNAILRQHVATVLEHTIYDRVRQTQAKHTICVLIDGALQCTDSTSDGRVDIRSDPCGFPLRLSTMVDVSIRKIVAAHGWHTTLFRTSSR
jgi:hypothetical protein